MWIAFSSVTSRCGTSPTPSAAAAPSRSCFAPDAEDFTRNFTARGLAEIVARVARAHDEWVVSKGFVFRPSGNSDAHITW